MQMIMIMTMNRKKRTNIIYPSTRHAYDSSLILKRPFIHTPNNQNKRAIKGVETHQQEKID
jgi:hypothetical protein